MNTYASYHPIPERHVATPPHWRESKYGGSPLSAEVNTECGQRVNLAVI
jgi:hypothetical protein